MPNFFDQAVEKLRVIINKPVDWSDTFKFSEQVRSFRIPVNKDNEALCLPAILVSPNTSSNNVLGGGTIYIADPVVSTAYARCYGAPASGYADNVVGLITNPRNLLYDQSATTPWVPARTGSVAAGVQGATPQTIIAAAGAGKKRRVFDLVLSCTSATTVSVSELNIAWVCNSATGATQYFHFGPTGVLQNTANTAIAVSAAGGNVSGNIVCDAGS